MFQKHLWEGAAEETSIEVYVSTSWGEVSIRHIRIFASWAENFYSASSRLVSHAQRE
jgi:hypothetical protein